MVHLFCQYPKKITKIFIKQIITLLRRFFCQNPSIIAKYGKGTHICRLSMTLERVHNDRNIDKGKMITLRECYAILICLTSHMTRQNIALQAYSIVNVFF